MSHLFAEGELLGKQMLLSRGTFVGKWFCMQQQQQQQQQQSVGTISSRGNIATSTLEIGPLTSVLGIITITINIIIIITIIINIATSINWSSNICPWKLEIVS